MKQRHKKGWLLFVVILLIAAGTVVLFWDQLAIYIAPKTVLTGALGNTYAQLEERFRDTPAQILLETLDPEGKQTVEMSLQTSQDLLGPVRYDMQLQTQMHRLKADGSVSAGDKMLDLSVYMDTEFAAVSSGQLVNGSYYGITYDTFRQDLKSIPLLSWFLTDSLIDGWEASVHGIQEKMAKTYTIPQLPQLSEEDMQKLMLAILAMPSDVEKTSITIADGALECYRITYSLSGPQVAQALAQFLNAGADAAVTAAFYLQEKSLVMLDLKLEAGDDRYHIQLEPGIDPAADPVTLIWDTQTGPDRSEGKLISLQKDGMLTETWSLRQKIAGKAAAMNFSYDWDTATEKMILTCGDQAGVNLTFGKTENGFRVETEEFEKLMAAISQKTETPAQKNSSCTMTVQKGQGIAPPEYKNLDKWSLEDFLTLLQGLGGLIGVQLV